ncbi:cytochrome P450 [Amylostereum chailletii]|nr:cytochrome P450 [Amylostereum chailletii]
MYRSNKHPEHSSLIKIGFISSKALALGIMSVTGPVSLVDVGILLFSLLFSYGLYVRGQRARQALPPGPKGWPLIGNIFDIPKHAQWLAYANWAREYGSPLIHVKMLGTHIVIANDMATAREILDKKASNFNLRPRLAMLNEAVGFGWCFAFTPNLGLWSKCRPLFQKHFRQAESRKWRPHEKRMASTFLRRLLETPDKFFEHVPYMAGTLILDMVYGIEVKPEENEFLHCAHIAEEGADRSGDRNIVDVFPWIQRFPTWLPGMRWKKQTDEWKLNSLRMLNATYEWVQEEICQGRGRQCLATDLLDQFSGDALHSNGNEYAIKSTCATAYSGGADTTVAYFRAFILAMVLFPNAQQRAHAELDRVVGGERLPDFSDESSLPYISALVKEVFRWAAVFPLGLPHVNINDDEWNGYFIPKGTVVMPNVWAILHDPSTYPEPEKVLPERFLTAAGQIDASVQGPDAVFGFGKRVCAGRFMAHDSMWYTTACILSVFDITAKPGKPLPSAPLFRPGLVLHTMPFECDIKPRSEDAVQLIQRARLESEPL